MYSSGGDYWTFSRVAENRRGRGERRRTRKSSHFLIGTLGFAWVLSQYRVMPLRDKFSPPKLLSLCTFQMLAFPLLFKCGPQALDLPLGDGSLCSERGFFSVLIQLYDIVKVTQNWVWAKLSQHGVGGVTCSLPLTVRTDEVPSRCSQNLANKSNRARGV